MKYKVRDVVEVLRLTAGMSRVPPTVEGVMGYFKVGRTSAKKAIRLAREAGPAGQEWARERCAVGFRCGTGAVKV